VLGDADKRKEYDEVRRLGPMAGGFGPGGAGPFGGGGTTFRVDDLGDIGDLFGGLFGGGGGRRGARGSRGSGPQRGADLETELHLSFEDAVHGVTTSVNITSEAACSVCHGSGATPGSSITTCPTCGGAGVTTDNQGLFGFSAPCTTCGGRGRLIEQPCSNCRGSGIERRPRSVKVRIPAGVNDGQRIRMKERGSPGRNGGPAGDLYVVIHIKEHPIFQREDDNLYCEVPIPFSIAALGGELAVPTLEGKAHVKVPPGTQSGQIFKLRGKGIVNVNGRERGDLLARVIVEVPTRLNAEQRQKLAEFADLCGDENTPMRKSFFERAREFFK
jgi:molecular chaperone DnaJ